MGYPSLFSRLWNAHWVAFDHLTRSTIRGSVGFPVCKEGGIGRILLANLSGFFINSPREIYAISNFSGRWTANRQRKSPFSADSSTST
jgi:hypothetical protein